MSDRIWMGTIDPDRSARVFALVRQCLAPGDESLVMELPPDLSLPLPSRLVA